MQRDFYLPCEALRPYIDRYWVWQAERLAEALPWMLPGTGAELMFMLGSRGDGALPVVTGTLPAFLICMRTQPYLSPVTPGACALFSVRLRSGALRHFCPLPLEDLFDRPVPIEDLWGASAQVLLEALAGTRSRREFIAILENWLLAHLRTYARKNSVIEAAIWHLYYQHHCTRIETLADQLGMSRRHFERVFRQHLGMTPKAFQRTARFHLTIRDLLLAPDAGALDAALAHGYYDQSHFIHEFESFVGHTPVDYLRMAEQKAHFYNQPLMPPDTVPLPR